MNKKTGILQINKLTHIPRPCKVYDIEKKELIAEFESCASASKFLGLKSPSHASNAINKKIKVFSPTLNKKVAIR